MNIFVLSKDPAQAARMMCDKHVVKMVLESTQMLCTAHHHHLKGRASKKLYKPAYANHPCTVWARQTSANYNWLLQHAAALCSEYLVRYGKVHASSKLIGGVLQNNPCPIGKLTPFAQAMPKHLKGKDPVMAYRQYYKYKNDNAFKMKWRKPRTVPQFFNKGTNDEK